MLPNTQRKNVKKSQQSNGQGKQKVNPKTLRPNIQEIYPVQIQHPQLMSPELKQYIAQLQRQYIERYNVLLSNRVKYDQMIENLAINLDQKGVSNHVIAQLLRNSSYHHEME